MSNDADASAAIRTGIALFAAIAVLVAGDIVADLASGASLGHVFIELIVLSAAAGGVVALWMRLTRTTVDLARARGDAARWQRENRELLAGLGSAIEGQFRAWSLTRAESDVALLLLKGFSHRDIANFRGTSERTVREQARSLYGKSGLAGRASLSAFFLEDLLLPAGAGEKEETRD